MLSPEEAERVIDKILNDIRRGLNIYVVQTENNPSCFELRKRWIKYMTEEEPKENPISDDYDSACNCGTEEK